MLYPLFLIATKPIDKSLPYEKFNSTDEIDGISIIMPAYNEEGVIKQKIESVLALNFPKEKMQFLIGTDNCSDQTDKIIQSYRKKFPFIELLPFTERQGKIKIINQLKEKATFSYLLYTDANVFFKEDLVFQLCKYFKDEQVSIVAARFENVLPKSDGIAKQESAYIQNENLIKWLEGHRWGAMMGAFGGCFAIRKREAVIIPENYIVDDFYMTMKVLEKKQHAICAWEALCFEDVSNELSEEFRRKIRIGTGNWQNVHSFKNMLSPQYGGVAFAFWSHKILRWLGPFLMLIMGSLSIIGTFYGNLFFSAVFLFKLLLLVLILLDYFLKKLQLHIKFIRFISHFFFMNLALLIGTINYLKGVQNNVWKPTRRNQ